MGFSSWLRNWTSNRAPRRGAQHRHAAPRFQPRLEALEDRCLPSFGAPTSYAVGAGPQSVATADLNNDGKLDLITASYSGVSVLLGNGNGTFASATNYAASVGYGTSDAVAVADLNGDGKLDIVTAGSVLLGNGDGTFKAAVNINGGYGPVVVGDFNHDGKLDMATTYNAGDYGLTYVHVLLNYGKKSFGFNDGGSYHLPDDSPSAMAVSDLNHDGNPDIIVTGGGYVSTLWGNPNRSYPLFQDAQSNYFGSGPIAVAVGDINGDGYPDFVTANSDGTVTVAWRNWTVGPSPTAVALGDFNGDGKLDIVTANAGNDTVSLLPGNGDFTFGAAINYPAGSLYFSAGLTVGDFNRDGKPDLATVGDYNAVVSVMLGANDWATTSHFVVSGFPSTTTAGVANTLTVTVQKSNGSTDTGYTGTVHFVSTDSQDSLPADYTFTAADQGTHTFTATLTHVSTRTLWATDTQAKVAAGAETGIVVQPAAASTFGAVGFPYDYTVGTTGTVYVVFALDAYGNTATSYNGTIHFTSSDPLAVLPADGTLTNGGGKFSATLNTAGFQLITVTDTVTPDLTGSESVRVLPRVTIAAPNIGLVNQPVTFTLGTVGDPPGTVLTYYIDWNNDGSWDESVTGPSGTTVTHAFPTSTNVGVYVWDPNVGLSDEAYGYISILDVGVTVQADPADGSRQMLVVNATLYTNDVYSFPAYLNIGLSAGANNGVTVTLAGTSVGNFVPTNGSPFALLALFGGMEYDTIDARALSISTVLVGGSGNDTLYGGSGRNLLIGGTDADTLYAGSAGDILIAGNTTYDTNPTALAYLMAEWSRTDADYATRIGHLNGSIGGGQNGSYLLNATTVFDDSAIDALYGGAGLDWFIAHLNGKSQDQVNGKTSGETATSI
jgi:hypothetical protein